MFEKGNKRRLGEIIVPVLFFVGGFILWEVFASVSNIPEFLLPKPSRILSEIFNQFAFFSKHLGITMMITVSGYLAANLLTFLVAAIFVSSKTIEKGLYPYAIAIKIAPILAIAPFVILWFGIGVVSKIVIVTLVCFFPLLVNTVKGLKTVDENALELLNSLRASKWQVFFKLRLPSALPFIFQGLKISSTLAMTGAFVGEFLAANQGIGYLILLYSRILETTSALAALFMMISVGILFFLLICLLERKMVFWQKSEGIYN